MFARARCHVNFSGYDGPWTPTPTKFAGAVYFKLLKSIPWKERQVTRQSQRISHEQAQYGYDRLRQFRPMTALQPRPRASGSTNRKQCSSHNTSVDQSHTATTDHSTAATTYRIRTVATNHGAVTIDQSHWSTHDRAPITPIHGTVATERGNHYKS